MVIFVESLRLMQVNLVFPMVLSNWLQRVLTFYMFEMKIGGGRWILGCSGWLWLSCEMFWSGENGFVVANGDESSSLLSVGVVGNVAGSSFGTSLAISSVKEVRDVDKGLSRTVFDFFLGGLFFWGDSLGEFGPEVV